MSITTRYSFAPFAGLIFLVFACLVLLHHHRHLEHIISQTPASTYPTSKTHIIRAFHTQAHHPDLSFTLASTLAKGPLQSVAYYILLSTKPEDTLLNLYACHTQFGAAKGLAKAAEKYFGVTTASLNVGETVILLHMAHHPNDPIRNPLATLDLRDRLLNRLYQQNILSQNEFQLETKKALAIAADHRPIN